MTTRRPLARVSGRTVELPPGDTIAGGVKIVFPCVGKPTAGEVVGFYVAEEAFTLPVNLVGSIARALTASTADAVWMLTQIPAGSATETTIATLTFAAGVMFSSFSTQAAVNVARGDVLRLKAPATADSNLSDVTFTIVGAR